jgi:V8-like Glu-specific endopeptidase
MVNRTAFGVVALVLVALALPATALALVLARKGRSAVKASPAKVKRMPTSSASSGVSEIGALYGGSGTTRHTCTASVVNSQHGDTLVTAAHCVAGNGSGMVFAPGQRGTRTPYGRWTVTAAYVEPNWKTSQDPHADVAFLTVAPKTINGVSMEIEQVTGAYNLGSTAVRGERVTVTGYPAGSADDSITCAAKVYLTKRYPSFDCRGFVDGTSGAPWLRATSEGTEVVGVIGGLNQGGCYDYTSFSAPLAGNARVAYLRASQGSAGDVAPQPGSDGC